MKASDLPEYYNAVDILERNLAERADKVALYSLEREMTFQEIAREANQVGHGLRKLGARPGEVIGILCPDSAEWVASFFGILKIGAVALGMNTLLKPHEYAYILGDTRTRVLIVHETLLESINAIRGQLPFIEHVVIVGETANVNDISYKSLIQGEPTELETVPTHREDIAMLNYSSGTTGEPKGIPHAHKDLPLTAQNWGVDVLGLREDDRTFAAAKLFFTFGTGGNLIFPWYVGASTVVFAGPPRIATNVLKIVDRFKPTILYAAPTCYASVVALEDFDDDYDLTSLRICVSAAEALPAPIWHAWKERTGVDILDAIGSTEVFHMFISNRPGDIRPGSSGKPFSGYELKIVDDNGNEVPRGEIGNLLVKGDSVALSYLHNYEASRKTFLGEWLFTGDKYSVDEDGYYWHAGRSDDMLKVGGIWVSPVEVEAALISHPAVKECAVIGAPDKAGLIKPKGFVILNEGHSASDELTHGLIERCKEKMAAYKRPRWIDYVEELPKTATGKIQRYKLRSQS
jgi:benzoate-CoA ligase family protein